MEVVQHKISYLVLEALQSFFGFGKIYANGKDKIAFSYRYNSLLNINKFIKIFDEAQLFGAKALDYRDFKIGIEIINKKKEHLTEEGLAKLKAINSNLNLKRNKFE
jgi:hypothetical protein